MTEFAPDLATAVDSVCDKIPVDWACLTPESQSNEDLRLLAALRDFEALTTAQATLMRDATEEPRSTVAAEQESWGHLRLERMVGEGSSAIVWSAHDGVLRRDVALKLFKERGPKRQKLLREGQLLARLSHPSIVQVYGAAEHEQQIGLWMELIEGRTLHEIVQDSPVEISEALQILVNLCDAVDMVHHNGILHLDVKASNVMREVGGRTVLMDFSASHAGDATTVPLAGTPLYMPPESFFQSEASAQHDVYSLGVLLFYLVSGRYPVEGDTIAELLDRHRSGVRNRIQEFRPDIPDEVALLIETATHPLPEERYSMVRDLGSDMTTALAGPEIPEPTRRTSFWAKSSWALGISVVLAAFALWTGSLPRSTGKRDEVIATRYRDRAVAVLPVRNIGESADVDYIAEGLTAEVIAQLARFPEITPISERSILMYKDSLEPTEAIAKALDVGFVVNATLRVASDRVRVIAELVNTNSGDSIWTETLEKPLNEVLTLQASLSTAIARSVLGTLPEPQPRRGQSPSADGASYDAFLRGRYHLNRRTSKDLRAAADYFRQAIEINPRFAHAHVKLAEALHVQWATGAVAPRAETVRREVRASLETALELDDGQVEAHTTLASLLLGQFNWNEAEEHFQRAMELSTTNVRTLQQYANYLTTLGRFDEAIEITTKAQQIDPLSPAVSGHMAWILYQSRDYQRALEEARPLLDEMSFYPSIYKTAIASYAALGDHEAAIQTGERAIRALPDDVELAATLAYAYAGAGQLERSGSLVERLENPIVGSRAMYGSLAVVYAATGDLDGAFDRIKLAAMEREIWLIYAMVEPRFDRMRTDPRWDDVIASISSNIAHHPNERRREP